jgi:hypothetical protein
VCTQHGQHKVHGVWERVCTKHCTSAKGPLDGALSTMVMHTPLTYLPASVHPQGIAGFA